MLCECNIQQVFSRDIPILKSYKDDPILSNYITQNSKDSYFNILAIINTLFHNSIAELTNFLDDIHHAK